MMPGRISLDTPLNRRIEMAAREVEQRRRMEAAAQERAREVLTELNRQVAEKRAELAHLESMVAKRRVALSAHYDILRIVDIQAAVAAYYDVTVLDMLSSRRTKDLALPRHVAIYLCRHLTKRSLPEIGRRTGNRDHTTVMNSVSRVSALIEGNAEVRADVEELKRRLAVEEAPAAEAGGRPAQ